MSHLRGLALMLLVCVSCSAGWSATVSCIPTVTQAACPGAPTTTVGPVFLTEANSETPPAVQVTSPQFPGNHTVVPGYLIINEGDGTISDIVRFFNDQANVGFAQLFSDPSLVTIPDGSLTLTTTEDATPCQGDPASTPGCIEYEVAAGPPDIDHPNGPPGASYFIQSDFETTDGDVPEPAAFALTLSGVLVLLTARFRRTP